MAFFGKESPGDSTQMKNPVGWGGSGKPKYKSKNEISPMDASSQTIYTPHKSHSLITCEPTYSPQLFWYINIPWLQYNPLITPHPPPPP